MLLSRILCAVLVCTCAGAAELTPEQRKLNVDSFEYAWNTIQKFMWEPMPAGVDWKQVHDQLKPKVEAAKSMDEVRGVLRDMISRLKMTHFGIVPSDVYDPLEAAKAGRSEGGSPGFDIRVLEGEATVVSVERDAPAYGQGVRPGWRILKAGGSNIEELIVKLRSVFRESTVKEVLITRAVAAKLDGPVGGKTQVEFLDAGDRRRTLDIQFKDPRGGMAKIGFLPVQHVWYESKKFDNTGYISFNMFLDPGRITTQFAESVESCKACDGIVIDLRGNPGGIGGMSMGMAGWFIDKPNVRLGVMKTKDNEVKFFVNPRPEVFAGPLAILVDGLTASTSEILAGGLKDLGRARIFGSPTAGAALPSAFERLPNGDGFQYAIANYISEGGRPLEGFGVIPDDRVKLTREALLAGRDPVLESALSWIRLQRKVN